MFPIGENRHRPLTAPLNLCPIYLKLLVHVHLLFLNERPIRKLCFLPPKPWLL